MKIFSKNLGKNIGRTTRKNGTYALYYLSQAGKRLWFMIRLSLRLKPKPNSNHKPKPKPFFSLGGGGFCINLCTIPHKLKKINFSPFFNTPKWPKTAKMKPKPFAQ